MYSGRLKSELVKVEGKPSVTALKMEFYWLI
jgi:hypothetical protein